MRYRHGKVISVKYWKARCRIVRHRMAHFCLKCVCGGGVFMITEEGQEEYVPNTY